MYAHIAQQTYLVVCLSSSDGDIVIKQLQETIT